jgi:hypothetical protein
MDVEVAYFLVLGLAGEDRTQRHAVEESHLDVLRIAKPKAKRASRASGARKPAAKAIKTANAGTKAKGPAKAGAKAKSGARVRPSR